MKYPRIWVMAILCLVVSTMAIGQDVTLTSKQIRKQRPKYLQIGAGFNTGNMRDFATSPIRYGGLLMNFSLARLSIDAKKEVKLTGRYNQGAYSYSRTEGFPVSSRAKMYALSLNYYRLYRLNKYSNDKWNFKVGGMFDVATTARVNEDFGNVGVGYEIFNTLYASGKVTHNFVRTKTITKKFLFIKYKRKPRLAQLSYQLSLPVMNGFARNGFAYIQNEGIGNSGFFGGYKYKLFSGFRLSSELAWTRQMQNGNMWRVAYIWDAYTTGGDVNRFEMGNHIWEFSLLFHLNKKMQP